MNLRILFNNFIDEEINKSNKPFTKRFKKIRKTIFNNYLDFCEKRSIDPLSITADEVITFLFVYVSGWHNTASYDIGYTLQWVYTRLRDEYGIVTTETLSQINKALNQAIKRRTGLKKDRYVPVVGELEVLEFYKELKNIESKIIFLCCKYGLTSKDIECLKLSQINTKIKCFTPPLRIYGLTLYKERIKKYRLLRYEDDVINLIKQYLSNFDIDLEKPYYKERLLFEGVKSNSLFSELNQTAIRFGFKSGRKFLEEFRNLMIVRLHRKGVPIAVIMDFMNISKFSVYVGELQYSSLNNSDPEVINRSINEAFDLSC